MPTIKKDVLETTLLYVCSAVDVYLDPYSTVCTTYVRGNRVGAEGDIFVAGLRTDELYEDVTGERDIWKAYPRMDDAFRNPFNDCAVLLWNPNHTGTRIEVNCLLLTADCTFTARL